MVLDNSGVTNSGGGGFFGGSGLSGMALDFSFKEVSFFNLIKSTTLNEFSFFNDQSLVLQYMLIIIKKQLLTKNQ